MRYGWRCGSRSRSKSGDETNFAIVIGSLLSGGIFTGRIFHAAIDATASTTTAAPEISIVLRDEPAVFPSVFAAGFAAMGCGESCDITTSRRIVLDDLCDCVDQRLVACRRYCTDG